MTANDMLLKIGETLGSTASVKTVFGEAIQANGKTIIPVATVAYGFGGGFGSKNDTARPDQQEGGGGGGGVRAYPAGALEITDGGTRFVPFVDLGRFGRLVAVLVAGALFILTTRRRHHS